MMKTTYKIVLSTALLGLVSACAYDPAYSYNSYSSDHGGSGYRSPYYGYSSYGSGYRNGYSNSGYPQSGYYNNGYGNGRYCPDDDGDDDD